MSISARDRQTRIGRAACLLLPIVPLALALVAAAVAGTTAGARPYGVEDLLGQQSYGHTLVDPTGRYAVIERTVPWRDAPSFDEETQMDIDRGRLLVVDLADPAPATLLVEPDPDAGYSALGFSPDGTHLAIGRLQARRWQLGIVDMASRTVRWFDLAPETGPAGGAMIAWPSNDDLVLISEPPGGVPLHLRQAWQAQAALTDAWARTARGRGAAVSVVGSGRLLGATPTPAPKRLVRLDVRSGEVHLLASGDFAGFTVSPDGRWAALLTQTDRLQPDPDRLIGVGSSARRHALALVAIGSGARWIPCAACDVEEALPRWSPTGDQLLAFARAPGADWSAGAPLQVDPARRRIRRFDLSGLHPVISGPPNAAADASFGWMGRTPLLFATAGAARADWYRLGQGHPMPLTAPLPSVPPSIAATRGGAILLIAQGGLWSVDRHGRARRASPPTGADLVAPSPTENGDAATPSASGSGSLLARWTRPGGGMRTAFFDHPDRPITLVGTGTIAIAAAVPTRSMLLWREVGPSGVTTFHLSDATGRTILLDKINRQLADVEPGRWIAIRSDLVPDGHLSSWLLLPPGASPRARPPLVVIEYPGETYGETPPRSQRIGQASFFTNAQILAGHGFAVLLPSMPPVAPVGHPADALLAQIDAPLGAVIARGLVDSDHVGLWGQSYGGWAAAMIASRTDRFKAIVASAGLYDLPSMTGNFAATMRLDPEAAPTSPLMAGWAETGQANLGTRLWPDPKAYTDNSPVFRADRIHTPLLLTAADMDISPLSQAEELFSALYRQGKDAELVTYWGEGHVIQSPDNVRDYYARILAWFDTHLMASAVPSPPQGAVASAAPPRAVARSAPATPEPSSRPADR